MSTSKEHLYRQWVNDQLDLYNYAGQIHDLEWQREIMNCLYEANRERLEKLGGANSPTALWKQYEEIIQEMISLYDQARGSKDQAEHEHIRKRMWQLKQQRIRVARTIRNLPEPSKKQSS